MYIINHIAAAGGSGGDGGERDTGTGPAEG